MYRLLRIWIQRAKRPSGSFNFECKERYTEPSALQIGRRRRRAWNVLAKRESNSRQRKNRSVCDRYFDDFPVTKLTNLWNDIGRSNSDQIALCCSDAVSKIVQRCLLMTTDPGDLVLDPTCGSGTTAYVAEQWGRRWITCDTSRVAITLAKQRLMAAEFRLLRTRASGRRRWQRLPLQDRPARHAEIHRQQSRDSRRHDPRTN